jgi:hypothetical protein
VVIHAGPMDGLGNEAPVIKAEDAPAQQAQVTAPDVQTLSQPAPGTAGLLTKPDQSVAVVAGTNPAPPRAAAMLSAPPIQMAAFDVPQPDPPKPAAESAMFGTPRRASTVPINPDATIMWTAEATPLPPTRPRSLASTDPTVRGKPSDARANAAGTTSFSIQLASSHSKSDALATLSRLKRQFPDVLGGGSVHRADIGSSGVYYRVQAGPLSRDAADKACSRLKASGENCIVVHS